MSVQKFLNFTGEENEKEFLETCLSQFEWTKETKNSNVAKLIQLSLIFREMERRLKELK